MKDQGGNPSHQKPLNAAYVYLHRIVQALYFIKLSDIRMVM
jgi:hypothetical protein